MNLLQPTRGIRTMTINWELIFFSNKTASAHFNPTHSLISSDDRISWNVTKIMGFDDVLDEWAKLSNWTVLNWHFRFLAKSSSFGLALVTRHQQWICTYLKCARKLRVSRSFEKDFLPKEIQFLDLI